jgi:hypothetical protein
MGLPVVRRVSVVAVGVVNMLRTTASMVLSTLWTMEREVRFFEVRLFEMRLFEVGWLRKVSKFLVVFLIITAQLAIDYMSCISCLVGNGFDDAL